VKRVGDLTRVVAPPYDVISPEEQEALHRRHPKKHHLVDFAMPKEGDGRREQVHPRCRVVSGMVRRGDPGPRHPPVLYYYEQEFAIPGKRLRAEGFLGAPEAVGVRGRDGVPHERTLSSRRGPLALMRATDAT